MKTTKHLTFFVALLVLLAGTFAFTIEKKEEHGPVKWMSFSEAVEKSKKAPRMIIIDVYTTWCGPCKMLSANTFGNEKIAKYMNDNFYCVKFDAETRDTVKFTVNVPDTVKTKSGKVQVNQKPQEYKFYNTFPASASRSTHQFASAIIQPSQIAFPSIVFISKDIHKVDCVQGYLPPAQFEPIIKYFGSGAYEKKVTYQDYQKSFKSEL